jgi:hypothetical protein
MSTQDRQHVIKVLEIEFIRSKVLGTTKVQLAAPGTVSAVGAEEEKTRILRKINKGL